ncbi:MAG: hypothetical protein K8S27_06090 [Candidatus Omnitrophica bacterium]|nr:hypothetical protein [Candidatus Omnitrophota bacterium]
MNQIYIKQKKADNRWGQTALELAVFGSVLLFVIGVTVKQSMNQSYGQHHHIRAMRMALQQSYMYSEGMMGAGPMASRNSATVIYVEDRLAGASAKFASKNRSPYMASGSASFSRHLFMAIEGNDRQDIARIDAFVNGQYFPLTISNYVTIAVPMTGPDSAWDPNCLIRSTTSFSPTGAIITTQSPAGCRFFPMKVFNHRASEKYCCGTPTSTCPNSCPADLLPEDDRFDLDRDGATDVVGPALRAEFGWQWVRVRGWDSTKNSTITRNFNIAELMNIAEEVNVMLDLDGDLKQERVWSMVSDGWGRAISYYVEDFQEGDWDSGVNDSDTKPRSGFQSDMQVYTKTEPGHYLLIEEGKLFAADQPGRQFVRNAQKKDQIDVISRLLQLSADTGRFCVHQTGFEYLPAAQVDPERPGYNPVEVCCSPHGGCSNGLPDCFSGNNLVLTCYIAGDMAAVPPIYPRIFVRSRIRDIRGRKWITDVQNDPYVNITY